MSSVNYNGIELKLVRTNVFGRDAVFSPDGVDYLYTRFTIDVTAVYNPGATSYSTNNLGLASPGPGNLPADTDLAIRHFLMQPRKLLVYSDEAGPILSSPLAGYPIDALNGPHPISCNVRQVVGSRLWIVTWRCETHLTECPPGQSGPRPGLVSNRYTVTDRIDSQQLTTRITAGAAIFRMDRLSLTTDGVADAFRNRIVLPVPTGFRRVSMDFSVNTIGNVLTYTIVDREQLYALGSTPDQNRGVLEFKASQAQSTVPIGESGFPAPFVMLSFNCRVIGAPNSSRSDLAAFAVELAIERLAIKAGPIDPNINTMLRRVQIAEDVDGRMVDLLMEVQVVAAKAGKQGMAGLRTEFIGADVIDLLVNDGQPPAMPNDGQTRGTFIYQLTPQLIQDACSVLIPPTPKKPAELEGFGLIGSGSEGTTTINVRGIEDEPEDQNRTSESGAGITDYKVAMRFETEVHKVQMPTTAPASSGGGSYGGGGPFGYGGSPGSTGDGSGGDGPPPAEILTLANPTTKLVIDWTAERIGLPPYLPHPELSDDNYTLTGTSIQPGAVIPGPDLNTPIYRVSGTYYYAALKPLDITQPIGLAIVPWSDYGFGEFQIPPEAWTHGITDEDNSGTA